MLTPQKAGQGSSPRHLPSVPPSAGTASPAAMSDAEEADGNGLARLESLQDLLESKDAELTEAQATIQRLRLELQGPRGGARDPSSSDADLRARVRELERQNRTQAEEAAQLAEQVQDQARRLQQADARGRETQKEMLAQLQAAIEDAERAKNELANAKLSSAQQQPSQQPQALGLPAETLPPPPPPPTQSQDSIVVIAPFFFLPFFGGGGAFCRKAKTKTNKAKQSTLNFSKVKWIDVSPFFPSSFVSFSRQKNNNNK
jgi:hypothetical protein